MEAGHRCTILCCWSNLFPLPADARRDRPFRTPCISMREQRLRAESTCRISRPHITPTSLCYLGHSSLTWCAPSPQHPSLREVVHMQPTGLHIKTTTCYLGVCLLCAEKDRRHLTQFDCVALNSPSIPFSSSDATMLQPPGAFFIICLHSMQAEILHLSGADPQVGSPEVLGHFLKPPRATLGVEQAHGTP